MLSKTVAELKLGTAPVISVREDDTALTTFQKIDSTGRSGVAVVNASNVLTGVTSSSDLKVRTLAAPQRAGGRARPDARRSLCGSLSVPRCQLYMKNRESLNLPIMDFLNKIRQMELKVRG